MRLALLAFLDAEFYLPIVSVHPGKWKPLAVTAAYIPPQATFVTFLRDLIEPAFWFQPVANSKSTLSLGKDGQLSQWEHVATGAIGLCRSGRRVQAVTQYRSAHVSQLVSYQLQHVRRIPRCLGISLQCGRPGMCCVLQTISNTEPRHYAPTARKRSR